MGQFHPPPETVFAGAGFVLPVFIEIEVLQKLTDLPNDCSTPSQLTPN